MTRQELNRLLGENNLSHAALSKQYQANMILYDSHSLKADGIKCDIVRAELHEILDNILDTVGVGATLARLYNTLTD